MAIEDELRKLALFYAKYDEEKRCYVSQLNKSQLLDLDRDYAKVLNQLLLADGPAKELITKRYHAISVKVHPDKKLNWCPEVLWLEYNLSQRQNNGACFKALHLCHEKFVSPEKFKNIGKDINFSDIQSKDDCKKWLNNLKEQSSTYTTKVFYDSLEDLLDQASGFFDDSGTIQPKGMRVLIQSLPMIFATYGAFIFAEEVLALYALYFVILKGGQYLETSDSSELRKVGRTLQEVSTVTATATTTLLVRLLEMTFWASRQCLDVSMQIGSALFPALLSGASSSHSEPEMYETESLCRDLVIASTNMNEGIIYKTPELKLISAPLESYLGLNSQQFFRGLRVGNDKYLSVEAFVFRMRVLDARPDPIEKKLIDAQKELEKIKNNKALYNGKTAMAVDHAEHVINLLAKSDEPSTQLVPYTPK